MVGAMTMTVWLDRNVARPILAGLRGASRKSCAEAERAGRDPSSCARARHATRDSASMPLAPGNSHHVIDRPGVAGASSSTLAQRLPLGRKAEARERVVDREPFGAPGAPAESITPAGSATNAAKTTASWTTCCLCR